MIIACPNCTQPYQLPDDQVAPLVQVQCAHCDYRVILDFEAANDPSLREPGMLLADGFRSEDDYNSALADGHSVTQHELPAPPPKPIVTKPTAPRTSPPVTAQTTQSAASRPSAIPQPTTRPKSGGLVSGLGLSDTPGSLAAAVTEHDRSEPEPEPEIQAEPPKAAEPELKAPEPEPEPEVKAPEPEPEVKAPEPEPEVKAPEPEPEVRAPEPEPEVKAPEPEPEVKKAPVKDAEPEKAAATPAAEEEGKGSGPFWIILIVIVIVILIATYATTGQLNPAQLLQPSK